MTVTFVDYIKEFGSEDPLDGSDLKAEVENYMPKHIQSLEDVMTGLRHLNRGTQAFVTAAKMYAQYRLWLHR